MTELTPAIIEDLQNALDLSSLPDEEQEEILLEIQDKVFEGVMLRIAAQLDDAGKDEFIAFLDSDPSEEALEAFIEEKVPNVEAIIEETFADMRNDILAATGESQE